MASSKLQLCSILFLLFLASILSVGGQISSSDCVHPYNQQGLENIVKAVSDAGYHAMSLTLEVTLPTLISSAALTNNNNSTTCTITIFAPSDTSFFALKYYRQPPLTLLKYHVAPVKLEKKDLDVVRPLGSKVNTLLPGHPLVITTSSHKENPRINGVEIKQWNLYNDGRVIIHGVDNFFDPAYQTILYPWFDEVVSTASNTTISKAPSLLQQEFELLVYAWVILLVAGAICSSLRYWFEKLTTGYELVQES